MPTLEFKHIFWLTLLRKICYTLLAQTVVSQWLNLRKKWSHLPKEAPSSKGLLIPCTCASPAPGVILAAIYTRRTQANARNTEEKRGSWGEGWGEKEKKRNTQLAWLKTLVCWGLWITSFSFIFLFFFCLKLTEINSTPSFSENKSRWLAWHEKHFTTNKWHDCYYNSFKANVNHCKA